MSRKRSRKVTLFLVPSVALLACQADDRVQTRHCVDKENVVVAEEECTKEEERARGAGPGYFPYYGWYYLPGSHAYGLGSNLSGITGGSKTPIAGRSIARGGFGGTARGFSAAGA